MDSSPISSKKAPKPVGLYPHARKVGNLLFLSGVGPRKAQSDIHDSFIPKLELDHNGNFKKAVKIMKMAKSYLARRQNQ